VILGGLIERVARGYAHLLPRPPRCAVCGGALKRRERARTLVGLVGDGAHWIWDQARAFVGLPRVVVVEIVDIYHAYGYL